MELWIDTVGYKAVLDDYLQSEKCLEIIYKVQNISCTLLSQTESGQNKLTEYLSDPKSWYSRSFAMEENDIGIMELFQAVRKDITFANEIGDYKKDVLELQILFLQKRIGVLLEKGGDLEEHIIKRTGESDELFRKRTELQKKLNALKGKKKDTKRVRLIKEKAHLEIVSVLQRCGFPETDIAKVQFVDENSNKIIIKLSGDQSSTAQARGKKGVYRAQIDLIDELRRRQGTLININADELQQLKRDVDATQIYLNDLDAKKESISPFVGRLFIAIELTNLISASVLFGEALNTGSPEEKIEATVNAIGSLTDAAGALEDVIRNVLRTDDDLKVAVIKSRSAANVTPVSKIALTFGVISIVSNICDISISIYHISELVKERRTAQVVGESFVIAGNVLSATGTVMGFFFAKQMADILILGVSLGGWMVIGAILLVVIGTILIWFFRPRPYKEWAQQCLWSNNLYSATIYENITADEIQKHYTRIYNVLCDFDVTPKVKMIHGSTGSRTYIAAPGSNVQSDYQKYYTFESITFMIRIGAFDKQKSRFWVNYVMNYDNSLISGGIPVLKLKEYEFSAKNGEFRTFDNNKYLVKSWNVDELKREASNSKYMTDDLNKFLEKLSTTRYSQLHMPSAFNTDATYFANLTKDYSVDKHGEFDAKWSVRLDYDGKNSAKEAFSIFQKEDKLLFPIIKLKKGSNGNVVPQ